MTPVYEYPLICLFAMLVIRMEISHFVTAKAKVIIYGRGEFWGELIKLNSRSHWWRMVFDLRKWTFAQFYPHLSGK